MHQFLQLKKRSIINRKKTNNHVNLISLFTTVMGCCQTNLASPNHPANVDPRKFIDKIKEDGSSLKHQGKSKDSPEVQEEYEYSVHGLGQGDSQQSKVSIFEQERKRRRNSTQNARLHAQIHPQIANIQNATQLFVPKSAKKFIHLGKSLQEEAYGDFQLSQILIANQPNSNTQHNHLLNMGIDTDRIFGNLKPREEFVMVNETSKAICNQTDRDLIQLHEEISTMIVLWDQNAAPGKKLRLEEMKLTQRDHDNSDKNQQAQVYVDKDLEEIWSDKENQPNQQKQLTTNQKLVQLKNQFILNANFAEPQQNHPQQECVLKNKKIQQTLSKNATTIDSNNREAKQVKPIHPSREDLKLQLSKIKNKQNPQPTQQLPINSILHQKPKTLPTQQEQSQHPSDQDYSQCLLSNPTRILNDSFVEEFNYEKEMFYFSQPHSYKKWIENDRKAYEISRQVVEWFLANHQSLTAHNSQPNFHTTFCILLCIIRDYKHLNSINLIAYRTFSSTSIFMQPYERDFNYSGFRIFIDGTRRIFPFSKSFDCTKIGLQLHRMISDIYSSSKNPAELMYNLTGWIPEYIVVDEINSFDGIFERLNNNFIDGNTIVTFTGKQNQSWGLKSINLEKKEITLYGNSKNKNFPHTLHQFQQKQSWIQFISLIHSINVNWNPLIYEYVWKSENVFFRSEQVKEKEEPKQKKLSISEIDPSFIADRSHQYLLKIPPSLDDIELRVFLETHYDQGSKQADNQPLVIQLYDYMGTRVQVSSSSIRRLQKTKTVYSDVLIFQSSKQRSQYILLVRPQHTTTPNTQIKYTISAYSFFEVSLSQLATQRVIQQKEITSFLQESHCGYGINSPHFLDNFYLQLKVPPLQRVRVFVEMPVNDCEFEINLIANPDGEENLTRLNLETILGEIITSEEFDNGKGYLQIETKYDQYFMMITNHTKCKGEFKIIIQVLEKQPKALTRQKLAQIQLINSTKDQSLQKLIHSKQKFFYLEPSVKKDFKWSPTNTGPRKRLKSNTHSGYQPFATFKEFFKNPYLDFKLQKGKKYQFSVTNQSYMEMFDSLQNSEDKTEAQPPTLSLGILKVMRPNEYGNSQKSVGSEASFKIVLDDAFYVPFGFGFWTKVMEFEEGEYRFVFPKMEKEAGRGTFCIYEVKP